VFVVGTTNGNYDGITNTGGYDAYITKYGAYGTKLWSKLIGTAEDDVAWDVTVSPEGLITVAGQTRGDLDGHVVSGVQDMFLAQFTQDGQKVWSKLEGGTGIDVANGIASDGKGSLIVAGQTTSGFDGQVLTAAEDGVVIKLKEDGTKEWTKIIGSTSSGSSYKVATSQDGSSYVAGYSNFVGSLTKYSADGTKVWQQSVDANHVLNFAGNNVGAVTTSTDGSVYITGAKMGNLDGQTSNGGNDAFVMKYSPDGIKLWTKLLGTSGTDAGWNIKAGSDGSVYVAGENGTHPNPDNAFLTKLSANGDALWTRKVGGSSGTTTGAKSLTVTTDGSVYLTGHTSSSLEGQTVIGGRDMYVSKFSTEGNLLWTRINGSTGTDEAYAIAS
jgi:predicted secreted protein